MGAGTARRAAPGGGSAVHGSCCCCCCWRPLRACRKCRAATSWERGGGSWGSCSSSRARHCHGAASPAAMHPHCIPVVPASLHRCIPIASRWCLHPLQQHIPIASPRRLHPCTNTFQWCQHPRTNASPLHLYGACIPAPTHPHGASIPAPMHPHCISVVPTSPAAMHQSCIPMVPASLHQCIPTVPACPHKCTPIASLWFQHPCTNASPAATHPRRTPRTNASLPPSCTDAAQLQRERQTPHPPLPSPAAAAADGGKGMQAADRALGAWDGRCWHRGRRVCRGGAGGGKETSGRAAGLSNAGAAPRHLDCPGNGGRGGGKSEAKRS